MNTPRRKNTTRDDDPRDADTFETDVFPEGVGTRTDDSPPPRSGTATVSARSLFGRRKDN